MFAWFAFNNFWNENTGRTSTGRTNRKTGLQRSDQGLLKRDVWNMETLEQLQARHRKEQRDLQARITQKKKAATKKTRKGVNTECDELERTLKDKQEQELAVLNGDSVPSIHDVPELDQDPVDENVPTTSSSSSTKDPVNGLADALLESSIASTPKSEDGEGRKRNRQKERLARRAAEQEAAAIEAEAEAAKLPNWKRQERSGMVKAFKENGLVEKEIAPDGHCLFSAVADQLAEAGIPLAEGGEAVQAQDAKYRVVRKTAARYIEGHPDEFAGFLDEPLGTYVHKIRDSAEWGGQLELIALAKSYNVEICVLQDGRIDRFEPETESWQKPEKIWLAYYRHGYGLGEHYNSLRKAP
jgi:OTU domain-containing protein 6